MAIQMKFIAPVLAAGAAAAAIVQPYLDVSTIPLAFFSTADTKKVNAQQEIDRYTRISGQDSGLTERLRDLDEMGIDIQLVMPPPFQCYYTVPLEISVKATRVVNDGIAEYVTRKPDRFVGLGSVPMTEGREAAAELDRLMRTLGLKGVQVLTNIAGRELSDPDFAPFWAKAEKLGALVVIHPNGFTEGGSPGSVTFYARPFGEGELLALANAYQDAAGFHLKHPSFEAKAV